MEQNNITKLNISQKKSKKFLYKKIKKYKSKKKKVKNISEVLVSSVDSRSIKSSHSCDSENDFQSSGENENEENEFMTEDMCFEKEIVEVTNKYNEVFYLQRSSLQCGDQVIRSGLILLSSQNLHWGEIQISREIFVVDGSCSILCKKLDSNYEEKYYVSKGETMVLFPGCEVQLKKSTDTLLLKIFVLYLDEESNL